MAMRTIVLEGDEVLRKKCKIVDKIDERILTLLDDMAETMHAHQGAGLAAPQVGVLKRIAVVDIGDDVLFELINPQIVKTEGNLIEEEEGCLSIPGVTGMVERPETVTVRALNRKGEEVEYTGTGLLAKAFCHELDHLEGVLFVDKAQDITTEA